MPRHWNEGPFRRVPSRLRVVLAIQGTAAGREPCEEVGLGESEVNTIGPIRRYKARLLRHLPGQVQSLVAGAMLQSGRLHANVDECFRWNTSLRQGRSQEPADAGPIN